MKLPKQTTIPVLQLKVILVPVHFSEDSNQLLQYAVRLAKKFNSKIILLHILPIHYITSCEKDIAEQESLIEANLKKDVKRRLAKLVEKVLSSKIPAESRIQFGSPALEIVDAAKESDADLILMSTHGHAGRIHAFFGSVSNDVMRLAPCPVLVVRPKEPDCSLEKHRPSKFAKKIPPRVGVCQ